MEKYITGIKTSPWLKSVLPHKFNLNYSLFNNYSLNLIIPRGYRCVAIHSIPCDYVVCLAGKANNCSKHFCVYLLYTLYSSFDGEKGKKGYCQHHLN